MQLSGPTLFTEVLQTAMARATRPASQADQRYDVLLILTDGIINDMRQVCFGWVGGDKVIVLRCAAVPALGWFDERERLPWTSCTHGEKDRSCVPPVPAAWGLSCPPFRFPLSRGYGYGYGWLWRSLACFDGVYSALLYSALLCSCRTATTPA